MEIQICRTTRDVWNLLLLTFIDDIISRKPLHLLKQTVTMHTEVRVNYLICHIHVPSKHLMANREANSRHTYDVTIWLSRTTDNSNIFIRSREVRDNESRLYKFIYIYIKQEIIDDNLSFLSLPFLSSAPLNKHFLDTCCFNNYYGLSITCRFQRPVAQVNFYL